MPYPANTQRESYPQSWQLLDPLHLRANLTVAGKLQVPAACSIVSPAQLPVGWGCIHHAALHASDLELEQESLVQGVPAKVLSQLNAFKPLLLKGKGPSFQSLLTPSSIILRGPGGLEDLDIPRDRDKSWCCSAMCTGLIEGQP